MTPRVCITATPAPLRARRFFESPLPAPGAPPAPRRPRDPASRSARPRSSSARVFGTRVFGAPVFGRGSRVRPHRLRPPPELVQLRAEQRRVLLGGAQSHAERALRRRRRPREGPLHLRQPPQPLARVGVCPRRARAAAPASPALQHRSQALAQHARLRLLARHLHAQPRAVAPARRVHAVREAQVPLLERRARARASSPLPSGVPGVSREPGAAGTPSAPSAGPSASARGAPRSPPRRRRGPAERLRRLGALRARPRRPPAGEAAPGAAPRRSPRRPPPEPAPPPAGRPPARRQAGRGKSRAA